MGTLGFRFSKYMSGTEGAKVASQFWLTYFAAGDRAPTTPDVTNAVEAMIRKKRRISIDKAAEELVISHGSAHQVVQDDLDYNKMSARFVPKQLSPELKERLADVCETLFRCLEDEGDKPLERTLG